MEHNIQQSTSPVGYTIVGFADNIAIGLVNKTVEEIEEEAKTAMRIVQAWLNRVELSLAVHTAEALLIRSRQIVENMKVNVRDSIIE